MGAIDKKGNVPLHLVRVTVFNQPHYFQVSINTNGLGISLTVFEAQGQDFSLPLRRPSIPNCKWTHQILLSVLMKWLKDQNVHMHSYLQDTEAYIT